MITVLAEVIKITKKKTGGTCSRDTIAISLHSERNPIHNTSNPLDASITSLNKCLTICLLHPTHNSCSDQKQSNQF